MPFGMTNVLAVFINFMNRVFIFYLDEFDVVLIEDILVYFKDRHEQTTHLRMVLQTLIEHQLYDKSKKCEFWLKEVVFLGNVVLRDGMKVDSQKVKAITEWPRPTDANEIRSFLGLASYYQSFCERLLKNGIAFDYLDEEGY